jgi:CBS domain-containing protein
MDVWTWPADRYYYGWYDTPPGAVGPPATDGQIKSEAVDRLRKNPFTAECDLTVDVKRGVVILRGIVPDRRAKRSAGDDCWDILGVRDVSNQLEVAEGQDPEGTVGEVMSAPALMALTTDPVSHVAAMMRDEDIGFVVVVDRNGMPAGVVTDRDIVTRAVAEGASPTQHVADLVTMEPASVDREAPIDEAVTLMRSYAVRRLPVVHDGSVVGVVSLGDLARERDPGSALADISAAPPD